MAPWAAGVLVGLGLLVGASGSGAQQRAASRDVEPAEFAPFRLTGIEGYVLGRYWWDGNDNVTRGFGSDQTASNLSAEFFVMTHSYVYHPNLLLLDLGAGPVLYRQGYSVDGSDSTANKATYNLTGRATFLRNKPYRGDLYYERKNDSQPVGPAQSLRTESTRYGFDFALLAPVTPVPIRVDANRYHTQGKGTDQVIDDRIDEFNFRAERNWGKLGRTDFHFQATQDDSLSGSLGLPIQATNFRTNRADLDTQLNFGAGNEFNLINTVSAFTQKYSGNEGTTVDTRNLRFDLNLQGRPSEALQTRTRYLFDAQDQSGQTGDQSVRLNVLNAGLTYQATPDLGVVLDVTGAFNRSTVFDSNAAGISGSVNYRRALPLGEVAATYGFAYFWRDQTASEPVVQVVGERAILVGTTWVPLRHPHVITSTIVVSNVPRTQTYVEGVDYTLREIGFVTEIQRLIDGNILDSQEVLVDYAYDTGGTYARSEFDNSVSLAWNLQSYFSVYARYFDSAPRLISGMPTYPLNPVQDKVYGARTDLPFALLGEEMRVGGFAEWDDRREVISPNKKTTYEAYVETSLPLIARGGIRLGARQQNTSYDYTPEQDVNSRTYNLRLSSRFRNGLGLSIDGTRTRDSGSPQVAREYRSAVAKAQWRVRRFLMTLNLSRTWETQGVTQSTHTQGELTLRREF